MEAPFFKFYPADWLSDPNVQYLNLEESGAYITILAYMWRDGNECTLPDDDDYLSRLLHVSKQKFKKIRKVLIDGEHAVLKKCSDGLIHNTRLDEEWEKMQKNREKRTAAANARWEQEKKEDANAMQMQSISNAHASSLHMQNDAISEVRSQKSDPESEKEKDNKDLLAELAQLFPKSDLSSTAVYDIEQSMNKGLELGLLNVAYRKAVIRDVQYKCPYVAKVLQGFVDDGIKTMADYEAYQAKSKKGARNNGTSEHKQPCESPNESNKPKDAADYFQGLLDAKTVRGDT